MITRHYTFHVKGISIVAYEHPDKRDVVTVNYKRLYVITGGGKRPTIERLWTDFKQSLWGDLIVEDAWLDLMMLIDKGSKSSVQTNAWTVKVPPEYQFDGVMR